MPVIDASFLLDLEDEVERAHALLAKLKGQDLVLPFQAALEYLVGIEDPVAAAAVLEASYRIVHSSPDFLLAAVELFRRSSKTGKRPSWADLQIGAVAALENTEVVTADQDVFEAMGLATQTWRPTRKRKPN